MGIMIGVIVTLWMTMIGVPAWGTTWTPAYYAKYHNVTVGYGSAGVDQLYWRTRGDQWASWYLRSYASSVDRDIRGMYGSFFASHTELLSHEVRGGDVQSRERVGKTIETSRVKGNALIQPVIGYNYSTNMYGPADLFVQIKECVDVIAWFDSCTSTYTVYNAIYKG
jgi:hypothetical protein